MPRPRAGSANRRAFELVGTSLPPELTSFVGREHEVADIKKLLVTTRVLTLTGAGGVGKTRLADHVAADVRHEYSDGVCRVDLQRLTDPGLVPRAVMSALRISEPISQPLVEAIVAHLRHRSLLLLLDNCEHLLASCAELTELLVRECSRLRVLATSREGLGIKGEIAFRVPSLSMPDLDHLSSLERLMDYEAVRLFIDRVTSSNQVFRASQSNAKAIATVCVRLDGIPLAIELAAARANVLTVEQIALRLTDRFRLLTGGSRTSLRRQQTLRATMDWSYDLLTEPERTILSRTSVFAGGWTLEAAEAICACDGIVGSAVLELLAHLVDKSLVVAETHQAEARYRLLETVREYAWEKLFESGQATAVRQRHRDWYLGLAERANPVGSRHEARFWMGRLETEHPNLRAALEWSKDEDGGAEAEARLAASLRYYWYFHGDWREARAWFEHALSRGASAPAVPMCHIRSILSLLLMHSLEYGRATSLCQEGLTLCRETGDREGRASLLGRLGQLAGHQGDYKRAKQFLEETVALYRELGDRAWTAWGLGVLGNLAVAEGDFERAMGLHTESLSLFREDQSSGIHFALRNLGFVLIARGCYQQAESLHVEGLKVLRDLGIRWGMYELLEGLASVASARRDFERAARILGATAAWREVLGDSLRVHVRSGINEQSVVAARSALGDATFAAIWADGRTLTLDQAVDYAVPPDAAVFGGEKHPADRGMAAALTPREREVAALIAQGLTNRQIASRLVISARTAESHVQHILDKLDLDTRGRIGVWAIEHGLYTPSQA